MTVSAPPIQDPVIEKNTLKAKLSWILWFNNVLDGDAGQAWSPVVTGLGQTGVATITGGFYQNQGYTDFWIYIVPGTNTTATLGSTYFDLPFDVLIDAPCFAVIGVTSGSGVCQASSNRCYVPAWTNVTAPVTITGRVRTG